MIVPAAIGGPGGRRLFLDLDQENAALANGARPIMRDCARMRAIDARFCARIGSDLGLGEAIAGA